MGNIYDRISSFLENVISKKWFWDNCAREKLPPTQKLTLIQTQTLTGGPFSSGTIVWLTPNPKTNPNFNLNSILTGGQFYSGGNCPDTVKNSKKY